MFARCKLGLVVAIFCAGALGAALAQTNKPAEPRPAGRAAGFAAAEQAVTKLEQEWFNLQRAHDWGKLTRMVADDFLLVESDGSLGNRDSMLAGYKAEAASIVKLTFTLLVSHAVASNVVIVTGLDDITLRDKNGNITHRYERFIDTWILRDGRWQCVAEQLTLAHP